MSVPPTTATHADRTRWPSWHPSSLRSLLQTAKTLVQCRQFSRTHFGPNPDFIGQPLPHPAEEMIGLIARDRKKIRASSRDLSTDADKTKTNTLLHLCPPLEIVYKFFCRNLLLSNSICCSDTKAYARYLNSHLSSTYSGRKF